MKQSIAIILKKDQPKGLVGNICACLATGIMKINPDIIGPDFEAHGLMYRGITNIPIVVVTENALGINEVLKRCIKKKMNFVLYDGKAIKETSYSNYMKVVQLNPPENREILGIGVIGESDKVRKIIGDLPLLR